MSTILSAILSAIASYIGKTLIAACNAVAQVFSYLNNLRRDKKEAAKEAEIKKASEEVANACDSGTLDDLLDTTSKLGQAKGKKIR